MPEYNNVLETLNSLKQRGYTTDFNLAFDKIKCAETDVCLSPADFEIVETYRFEGMSNPDDSSIVYAIESKAGKMKGVLVNAYGIYSDKISDDMLKKLTIHRKENKE